MSPAAGWYADPYKQAAQRYWDGAKWTGHVHGTAPAAEPTAAAARPPAARGFVASRLRSSRTLIVFVGLFAVIVVGGAVVISAAGRGSEAAADCPPDRICSDPPIGNPLVNGTVWRSDEGASLEYDAADWEVIEDSGKLLAISSKRIDVTLIVSTAPASDSSPEDLRDERLDVIRSNTVGLTKDTDHADRLYGPGIGYVDGTGGAYTGAIDSPQGLLDTSVVVMGAGTPQVSAAAGIITTSQRADQTGGPDYKAAAYGLVDSVLNTFRFQDAAS